VRFRRARFQHGERKRVRIARADDAYRPASPAARIGAALPILRAAEAGQQISCVQPVPQASQSLGWPRFHSIALRLPEPPSTRPRGAAITRPSACGAGA
jgi:hypothetical protein